MHCLRDTRIQQRDLGAILFQVCSRLFEVYSADQARLRTEAGKLKCFLQDGLAALGDIHASLQRTKLDVVSSHLCSQRDVCVA